MKNSEIITACERAKQALKNNLNGNAAEIIHALQEAAETEQRAEKAKTNGTKAIYTAATRILKNSAAYNQARPALLYSYNDGQRVNVCDGFKLIQFNAETAPELPALPEKMQYIDAARVMDPATENAAAVTLPGISELKNYIKIEKAKKKAAKDKTAPVYVLTTESGQKVHTNAIYLLDVIECLPGATAKASARGPLYPLYFESENGRGILCPVRPGEGAPA